MAADRAKPTHPLTPAEFRAVQMIAEEQLTYGELASVLGVSKRTVQMHMRNAGMKIPGDLPLKLRCIAWYRGSPTWTLPEC